MGKAEREMELEVCAKCGWYTHYGHERECSPAKGAAADKLAQSCAGLGFTATKLGYGFGRLTFQADDGDVALTFQFGRGGTVDLERVHCLRDLDLSSVQNILKSFAGAGS